MTVGPAGEDDERARSPVAAADRACNVAGVQRGVEGGEFPAHTAIGDPAALIRGFLLGIHSDPRRCSRPFAAPRGRCSAVHNGFLKQINICA
ncbi:hypothetical protein [Sciscionella marina]|uniref:hypothetical protein n=1 Tax=Sciscionella marina TaxID=508770 RepID=UPI0012F6867D|nr:hypothetical protein [Sciscionella marina]